MASRWHLIDEHEIVWLIADHRVQRRLCTVLESIADDLPNLPSTDVVVHVERQLAGFAERHVPLETELFQRLFGDAQCPSAERVFHQIHQSHAIDAMHADDLSAELRRLSGSSRVVRPGELAYMLRCFFDGCRRAMAFEELALLSLGSERLTPAARSAVLLGFRTGPH